MEPEFHRNVVWLLDGNGYPCGAFQPFQSECRGECDAVPHGYEYQLIYTEIYTGSVSSHVRQRGIPLESAGTLYGAGVPLQYRGICTVLLE